MCVRVCLRVFTGTLSCREGRKRFLHLSVPSIVLNFVTVKVLVIGKKV